MKPSQAPQVLFSVDKKKHTQNALLLCMFFLMDNSKKTLDTHLLKIDYFGIVERLPIVGNAFKI